MVQFVSLPSDFWHFFSFSRLSLKKHTHTTIKKCFFFLFFSHSQLCVCVFGQLSALWKWRQSLHRKIQKERKNNFCFRERKKYGSITIGITRGQVKGQEGEEIKEIEKVSFQHFLLQSFFQISRSK